MHVLAGDWIDVPAGGVEFAQSRSIPMQLARIAVPLSVVFDRDAPLRPRKVDSGDEVATNDDRELRHWHGKPGLMKCQAKLRLRRRLGARIGPGQCRRRPTTAHLADVSGRLALEFGHRKTLPASERIDPSNRLCSVGRASDLPRCMQRRRHWDAVPVHYLVAGNRRSTNGNTGRRSDVTRAGDLDGIVAVGEFGTPHLSRRPTTDDRVARHPHCGRADPDRRRDRQAGGDVDAWVEPAPRRASELAARDPASSHCGVTAKRSMSERRRSARRSGHAMIFRARRPDDGPRIWDCGTKGCLWIVRSPTG